jgi:hypothetical protein
MSYKCLIIKCLSLFAHIALCELIFLLLQTHKKRAISDSKIKNHPFFYLLFFQKLLSTTGFATHIIAVVRATEHVCQA